MGQFKYLGGVRAGEAVERDRVWRDGDRMVGELDSMGRWVGFDGVREEAPGVVQSALHVGLGRRCKTT